MPLNPTQVIDRKDFNSDLTVKDAGNTLTRFPSNLGSGGFENENIQAILFKFHNPIPGQIEPKHPALQGDNKYIALPLPAELPFTDSYNYDDMSTLQSYGTWFKSILDRTGQNLGNIFNTDLTGIDLGNRISGLAANSKAAVTFQNPNFRTFTFSWDMIANSPAEAKMLHTIVQKFRIAAASHFQDGNVLGGFIEYPDLVSFVIYPGNFKAPFPASYPCFIESVGWNPVSHEGQIPFFVDGAPVGWRLSLTLKESMYLDKKDIQPDWDKQGF